MKSKNGEFVSSQEEPFLMDHASNEYDPIDFERESHYQDLFPPASLKRLDELIQDPKCLYNTEKSQELIAHINELSTHYLEKVARKCSQWLFTFDNADMIQSVLEETNIFLKLNEEFKRNPRDFNLRETMGTLLKQVYDHFPNNNEARRKILSHELYAGYTNFLVRKSDLSKVQSPHLSVAPPERATVSKIMNLVRNNEIRLAGQECNEKLFAFENLTLIQSVLITTQICFHLNEAFKKKPKSYDLWDIMRRLIENVVQHILDEETLSKVFGAELYSRYKNFSVNKKNKAFGKQEFDGHLSLTKSGPHIVRGDMSDFGTPVIERQVGVTCTSDLASKELELPSKKPRLS